VLEAGRYFFHYTTREAAFGGIMAEHRLRLATYGRMRDPLENQPWRFTFGGFGLGPEDDAELIERLNDYSLFEGELNVGVRDRSHLLSLTVDVEPDPEGEQEPFCRGWARARMWEQYAERHRGVCLVFDKEELTDSLMASVPGLVVYSQKVIYDGRGMMKPLIDHRQMTRPGYVAEYINDNSGSLFFTKARDWETEHEHRFVVTATDDAPIAIDYGDSLSAVIAGDQLPAWELPAMIAKCQEAGVEALKMKWANWRPGLVAVEPRRADAPEAP
jgi:hypothetical protein